MFVELMPLLKEQLKIRPLSYALCSQLIQGI